MRDKNALFSKTKKNEKGNWRIQHNTLQHLSTKQINQKINLRTTRKKGWT